MRAREAVALRGNRYAVTGMLRCALHTLRFVGAAVGGNERRELHRIIYSPALAILETVSWLPPQSTG